MVGQAQMAATYPDSGHAGEGVDVGTVVVTFRADRFATEHLLVEVRELAPVPGDEICVGVAYADGGTHGLLRFKSASRLIGKP
jgi:hypothetical protein